MQQPLWQLEMRVQCTTSCHKSLWVPAYTVCTAWFSMRQPPLQLSMCCCRAPPAFPGEAHAAPPTRPTLQQRQPGCTTQRTSGIPVSSRAILCCRGCMMLMQIWQWSRLACCTMLHRLQMLLLLLQGHRRCAPLAGSHLCQARAERLVASPGLHWPDAVESAAESH